MGDQLCQGQDTFYFKYPFLDTVWCSTDRNRLEMYCFKTISAFFGEDFAVIIDLIYGHVIHATTPYYPIDALGISGYNHVRIQSGGEAMKQETIARIRRFTKERDWEQYHTPANLAKSISIEAGELLECFQWSDTDYDLTHAGEELADVMVYCQNMLDALGLDADAIITAKMDQNEAKYPVEKCRGSNAKYDQL